MTGIKMSDCHFYINKDARTIVCVIPDTYDMLYRYIEDNFKFPDIDIYFSLNIATFEKTLQMPASFMGKAVCAEEDEWNEDLGRKIAFSRAKDKCYRSFFKRANMLVNRLDLRLGNMVESFNTFGEKLAKKKDDLQRQIDIELDK